MPLDVEHYRSACHTISVLTHLEVLVFDAERALQIHVASYELPDVLEQLRQEALIRILQQPPVREEVVVFRDALQLKYVAASIWHDSDWWGTVVLGPAISTVFHPHLLKERNPQEPFSAPLQKQFQADYDTLPLIDEVKQQAIGTLLLNLLSPGVIRPRLVEASLPLSENPAQRLAGMLEEHREMVEKRYTLERNIFHAISAGDGHLLTKALEGRKDISWTLSHPGSPVRSLKNLALAGNVLYRKAAEYGGVHPLHLDGVSQKFAIQIEEARNMAELLSMNEDMPTTYCNMVKDLSVSAFPPLIREAVTALRLHLDQPCSLHELASTLGVNPTYLSRTFTRVLGMTFKDYLNQLRIEEARYLLDQSTDSITTIALAVGFRDANYFSKVFRKLEGMTPHDYRRRNEGERGLEAKDIK